MSTPVIHAREAESLRVLLVEDNPVDARLITALLRSSSPSLSIQCSHVTRLDEAIARLVGDDLDVVLLDLNLDDSAGYETFHRVRQATAKAAILVLSGSDDEELAIKTVREGAQDYILKGTFDGRLLLRSIRYAIEAQEDGRGVAAERGHGPRHL